MHACEWFNVAALRSLFALQNFCKTAWNQSRRFRNLAINCDKVQIGLVGLFWSAGLDLDSFRDLKRVFERHWRSNIALGCQADLFDAGSVTPIRSSLWSIGHDWASKSRFDEFQPDWTRSDLCEHGGEIETDWGGRVHLALRWRYQAKSRVDASWLAESFIENDCYHKCTTVDNYCQQSGHQDYRRNWTCCNHKSGGLFDSVVWAVWSCRRI